SRAADESKGLYVQLSVRRGLRVRHFKRSQYIYIRVWHQLRGFFREGQPDPGVFVADIDVVEYAVGGIFQREFKEVILCLGKIDDQLLFVLVVCPGDMNVRVAGGEEP